MSLCPRALFSAAIFVLAVASVATSQPPPEAVFGGGGSDSAAAGFDSAPTTPSSAPAPTSSRLPGRAVGSTVPAMRELSLVAPTAGTGGGAAGDMIGFSHADGSGTQTITLVDTRKSWMAVYHVSKTGTIRLVSSRPIDADFSLQLNATSPLPEEIRRIGNR